MLKKTARKINKSKHAHEKVVNVTLLVITALVVFLLSAGFLDKYFCFGEFKCRSGAAYDVNDLYGLSIDPNNRGGVTGQPKISELNDLKITWVRMEFIENPVINYKAYIDELHNNNKKVLMIVDYRTINSFSKPSSKNTPVGSAAWTNYRKAFIDKLKPIASTYKNDVDAWEVWNEPDLFLDGSYDPGIPAQEYAKFLNEARDVLKNAGVRGELIVGGLASGNQNYLKDTIKYMGVNFGYDGIGVHPYGQRPNTFPTSWGFSYVSEFLNKYYTAGGNRPLWITEIGTDDTTRQANYLAALYNDIKDNHLDKVKHVFWFCYSDSMVVPYGLLQSNGVKKDTYTAHFKVVNNDAIYPAIIYSPIPNASLTSNKATFSWGYNTGKIDKYKFTIKDSSNATIYSSDLPATQKSIAVSNLPTDGGKLITTLESYYKSNPYPTVQTYFAFKTSVTQPPATKPTITVPVNNSTIALPFTFKWTNSGATEYHLYLSSSVGGNDLYSKRFNSTTFTTVVNSTDLLKPLATGSIYARLWSNTLVSGIPKWESADYTYNYNANPPPSNTQPQPPTNSKLLINAQGVYSGKPPVIKIVTERSGLKTYHGSIEVTSQRDYAYDLNFKLSNQDKVYLNFCNDTSDDGVCSTKAGSSNRDIIFSYLKVDGVKVSLKSPIVYVNGSTGPISDIHYDRANKEDGALYDNGTIRDVSTTNGDFGNYYDGKGVFYGGEAFHWGPIFNGFMPFNGAIVAKVNWN